MAIKYEENLSLTSFVCSTSGHTFFFLSFSTRWQYLLPGTVLIPTERVENVTPTDWTQSDDAGGFMKLILPLQKSILTFLKNLPEAAFYSVFNLRWSRRGRWPANQRTEEDKVHRCFSTWSTTKKQTGRFAGFTPEVTRATQQHLLAIGLANAFYGNRS